MGHDWHLDERNWASEIPSVAPFNSLTFVTGSTTRGSSGESNLQVEYEAFAYNFSGSTTLFLASSKRHTTLSLKP